MNRLLALLASLSAAASGLAQPEAAPPPARVYKTGAKPSAPAAIAATPKFLRDGKVGAPAQFAAVPKRIAMWGNDQYGDCVTVEECFAKIADNPHVWVSEQECVNWARRHGVLNGATLIEVLEAMRKDGLRADDGKLYTNGPYYAVDYRDKAALAEALYTGRVKIAVASGQVMRSMNEANGRSGWHGTNWRTDNRTDHCVPLCGYGPASFLYEKLGLPVPAGVKPDEYGYLMFTWNSIGFVSHQSLVAVCREAYVRNPTTEGYPPHPEPEPKPDPKPDPGPGPQPTPEPPAPTPVCPVPRWAVMAITAGALLLLAIGLPAVLRSVARNFPKAMIVIALVNWGTVGVSASAALAGPAPAGAKKAVRWQFWDAAGNTWFADVTEPPNLPPPPPRFLNLGLPGGPAQDPPPRPMPPSVFRPVYFGGT